MGLECCIGISGFGMHGILVCKSEGRLVYRDYYREIITRYAYIRNWYANRLCGMHIFISISEFSKEFQGGVTDHSNTENFGEYRG